MSMNHPRSVFSHRAAHSIGASFRLASQKLLSAAAEYPGKSGLRRGDCAQVMFVFVFTQRPLRDQLISRESFSFANPSRRPRFMFLFCQRILWPLLSHVDSLKIHALSNRNYVLEGGRVQEIQHKPWPSVYYFWLVWQAIWFWTYHDNSTKLDSTISPCLTPCSSFALGRSTDKFGKNNPWSQTVISSRLISGARSSHHFRHRRKSGGDLVGTSWCGSDAAETHTTAVSCSQLRELSLLQKQMLRQRKVGDLGQNSFFFVF